MFLRPKRGLRIIKKKKKKRARPEEEEEEGEVPSKKKKKKKSPEEEVPSKKKRARPEEEEEEEEEEEGEPSNNKKKSPEEEEGEVPRKKKRRRQEEKQEDDEENERKLDMMDFRPRHEDFFRERDAARDSLVRLMVAPEKRLIVITGNAGTGKRWLANMVARDAGRSVCEIPFEASAQRVEAALRAGAQKKRLVLLPSIMYQNDPRTPTLVRVCSECPDHCLVVATARSVPPELTGLCSVVRTRRFTLGELRAARMAIHQRLGISSSSSGVEEAAGGDIRRLGVLLYTQYLNGFCEAVVQEQTPFDAVRLLISHGEPREDVLAEPYTARVLKAQPLRGEIDLLLSDVDLISRRQKEWPGAIIRQWGKCQRHFNIASKKLLMPLSSTSSPPPVSAQQALERLV